MITKNNYSKRCLISSNLLFGVLVGLILTQVSFASDIKVWNFREDFANSTTLSSQPIIKDKSGRETWFLKYSYDSRFPQGVFTPSTFQPMNAFVEGERYGGCSPNNGLFGWTLDSFLPEFSINLTGVDVYCDGSPVPMPRGAVWTHPRWDAAGLVEWHSPISGPVSIEVTLTDLNPISGNGIAWFLGKNNNTLR
jgi:hypothetical protein